MEESELSSSLDIRGLPTGLRTLKPLFERAAREVFAEHDIGAYAVSISFVDDDEICRMNLEALNRSTTTDVIAFDLSEAGLPFEKVGDLYVCLDTAEANSKRFGVGLREELIRLVIHGLLHLVGYEDGAKAKREIMAAVQERIVKRLSGGLVS